MVVCELFGHLSKISIPIVYVLCPIFFMRNPSGNQQVDDVVNVDEGGLEWSDMSGIHLNGLLVKN